MKGPFEASLVLAVFAALTNAQQDLNYSTMYGYGAPSDFRMPRYGDRPASYYYDSFTPRHEYGGYSHHAYAPYHDSQYGHYDNSEPINPDAPNGAPHRQAPMHHPIPASPHMMTHPAAPQAHIPMDDIPNAEHLVMHRPKPGEAPTMTEEDTHPIDHKAVPHPSLPQTKPPNVDPPVTK